MVEVLSVIPPLGKWLASLTWAWCHQGHVLVSAVVGGPQYRHWHYPAQV